MIIFMRNIKQRRGDDYHSEDMQLESLTYSECISVIYCG